MVKKKLTLSIDEEVLSQAKQQGINLSSFLEIRLSDYLLDKDSGRGGIRTRDHWLRRPVPYPG